MPADPAALYIAIAALFGLLFGSFLNVCIYRLPRDLSVVAPRSFCPECGSRIAWYENVPLLSYAFLRGRCRHCAKPIGIRYVLVEVAAAALFALSVWKYGASLAAVKWCVFDALMLALFWTDLEERILPDELTLGGFAAGIVFAFFVMVPGLFDFFMLQRSPALRSLCNALLGAAVLSFPVWIAGRIYTLIRKREGVGFGDIKLLAAIGAFLGLESGLLALLIGAVSGSAIGIAYILWRRKDAATYELPFGSFLCFGAVIAPFLER